MVTNMAMETIAVWLKIDEEHVVPMLQETAEKLVSGKREMALDFSAVRQIDASALDALEAFARTADEKGVKVVLRGVNIAVYKVLKLVKLASRFDFESSATE
jgi:anti-anti-sigma regulatory factor